MASALRAARGVLAGFDSASSDADELVSRLLDVARSRLPALAARELTPDESARLDRWLERRLAHEPVPYITGRAAFRDLDLAVDPRVLVPRPETEGLVEHVLEALGAASAMWPAPRVIDLGTGSGAIALSIAAEWPAARVTATDASAEALALARANAGALGLVSRIRFVHGDWFGALATGERCEVVVSNPPYVAEGEWDGLPADIRDFEPRRALLSGPAGLDATRAIVSEAPVRLVGGGLLAIELAEERASEVAGWLDAAPAWSAVELRPDLAGCPRYLLARRAGDAPRR